MRITKTVSDYRVHSSEIKYGVERTIEELFKRYGDDGTYFNKPVTVIIDLIDENEN